ncbi:MAG: dephospho-CoA kinase [Alphaproteobacteria bacterium]|nr:dephospho-CoA kinase [Alphaproteobacteria bacterium]
MIILGLTGSIGMGKSTAARMLRRLGVPLFDADATVHRLLGARGGAAAQVEAAFPGVRGPGGAIDRGRLGQRVFGNADALRRLERILHPMVADAEKRFLGLARARRAPVVVLDIPLLFESRGGRGFDYVLVVSAPAWVQRQRVLRRPGMSAARFASILGQQTPDREKRRRADFVVSTGLSHALTQRQLRRILALVQRPDQSRRRSARPGSARHPRRR